MMVIQKSLGLGCNIGDDVRRCQCRHWLQAHTTTPVSWEGENNSVRIITALTMHHPTKCSDY